MNRRDAFKLFVASAVSLLGMKGLAETLRPRVPSINPDAFTTLKPVMGEQAHWPETARGFTSLQPRQLGVSYTVDHLDTEGRAVYEEMDEALRTYPNASRAKVTAAKIDGRWVNTSDWTPEQIEAIGPGVLKQSPGTGNKMVALPALGPGPHTLEVGYSEAG